MTTPLSKYEQPPYTGLTVEQVSILKLGDRLQVLEAFTVEQVKNLMGMIDALKAIVEANDSKGKQP